MNDDALGRLRESGLFSEVLAIELTETPGSPVFVRPEAGEGEHDWAARLAPALALGPGARVGVAAEDAALAATTAVRLAVSVADAGRRVIVVDGSVRAPVIAKALEGDGDEGLVDSVMFGVSTAVTARRTLAAGVSLMTSGSVPVSAEDVFRSDNFEATLRGFAQDVIAFVALPTGFVSAASHALSDIVLLGRTAAELESACRSLADAPGDRPSRTTGILVAGPRPPRPAGLAEPLGSAETPPERPPETAEVATASEGPRTQETVQADAAPPPSPLPEYRRRAVVRTAHRTPPPAVPERRRRARPVVLAVLGIALVALAGAWRLGALDALLGGPSPPGTGSGAERPSAGPSSGAPGAAGATAPSAADSTPAPTPTPQAPVAAAGARQAPVSGTEEPATEAPAPAPAPLRGPGGRYVVYVSSHRTETAAVADGAALEELSVASAVVRAEVDDSGVWYRVRVAGGYPTLDAARQALEAVRGLSYDGAWIERTPESQ